MDAQQLGAALLSGGRNHSLSLKLRAAAFGQALRAKTAAARSLQLVKIGMNDVGDDGALALASALLQSVRLRPALRPLPCPPLTRARPPPVAHAQGARCKLWTGCQRIGYAGKAALLHAEAELHPWRPTNGLSLLVNPPLFPAAWTNLNRHPNYHFSPGWYVTGGQVLLMLRSRPLMFLVSL